MVSILAYRLILTLRISYNDFWSTRYWTSDNLGCFHKGKRTVWT